MPFFAHHHDLALKLFVALEQQNARVATAESCTGGLIAGLLTEAAGSSAYFERGFVTYSNEAKQEMLDVTKESLFEFGAVSKEVARQMAQGALAKSEANFSVSVTGIAGPGGATANKPVGLVYIGVCSKKSAALATKHLFNGDRQSVRNQTIEAALKALIELIKKTD